MNEDPAIVIVLVMLGVMLAILASAVAALYWAASRGEFNRLEEKSHSIFGADEPVGQVTDSFPGQPREKSPALPEDARHD
ncbi:MAG: hypothetical protein AAGK14_08195 [Verrucomicrobiota bacterium]